MDGKLDNVSIWDSQLSAAAVSSLYNSGACIPLDAAKGSYSASDVATLAHWWRLGADTGDATGTDGILDTVGSVHGTATNMELADLQDTDVPPWKNTYSFSLDGVNDRGYTASSMSGIPGSGGYTVSLWAKATSWGTGGGTYDTLFTLGDGTTQRVMFTKGQAFDYYRGMRIYENGTLYSTGYQASPASIDGVWSHWAITSTTNTSAQGTITIYRDGSSIYTVSATSGALTGTDTLYIGTGAGVSAISTWLGWLDEVALYDTALPATGSGSVAEIYASGKAVNLKSLDSEPNLKHWYRLGDGDGDATQNGTIYDQQGSLDLTTTGLAAPYGRVEDAPST